MAFKWSIPSLMVARYKATEYDADAQALFDAAEISDDTVKNAVNTLIIAFKASGFWNLCNAIYGFAGDNVLQTYASQYKYNWKDPRDLDAAFRLSFVNSPTITATGVDWNGSTQYADTFIQPSTVLTIQDTHLSYYSRQNVSETGIDIGAYNAGTQELLMTSRHTVVGFFSDQYDDTNGRLSVANSDSRGLFMGSRLSSTDHAIYKNGVSQNTNATSGGTRPTTNILLGAVPDGGGGVWLHSTKECAFATIGAGVSSAIAADTYTDIQTYQTSMGRQV